jgi:mono/diheme cytochrome c family protein
MKLKAFVLGALATFVVLGAAGLVAVWTGAYDVAASSGHARAAYWVLHTTMRNSVQRQAKGLEPLAPFTAANVAEGAEHFKGMCVACHGAPRGAAEREEWAQTIVPRPPELVGIVPRWTPGELFWIVKHGIKMTAMPAFGPTHSDQDIWNIVAFLKALPTMSAAEYARYPAEGEEHEHSHGASAEHEHEHEHGQAHEEIPPSELGDY